MLQVPHPAQQKQEKKKAQQQKKENCTFPAL
jgi:hypothetical protein